MTDTMYRILWIVGTMAGALVLGLMLFQFVSWLLGGGVDDEENNRPLFPKSHRHPTYPESIVTSSEIDIHANRETRHEQMRQAIGVYTEKQIQRRADKHAEQIVEQFEQE